MPGRELEPLGRSGPVLSEVAAEMSAIFVRAGLGESVANLRPPPAVSALRPGQRGGTAAMLLVGAAAGLVGLGAGAFMIHAPSPATPAHAAVQVSPPQAAPPIALAEASPAPAIVEPPPAAKPARASPLKVPARPPPRAALAEAPPVRRREAEPQAQPASCERNAAGVGCRRAVIQADQHLRAVYESAVRRGVPHAVLVDYRDRWADLRDRDTEDPVQLIESYGALAYDLGRETRSQQADAERRRGPSGWKAVADAFRPLPLR